MEKNNANDKGIGRPGDAARVLNFAGGAFDTVMQLGVVHALLVIQGRPPDAIVGISAGAIQAAASAEVLQAGEAIDDELVSKKRHSKKEKEIISSTYRRRQEERVRVLRHFIAAAERAPERLIDTALPDAYEIESRDPLQPLRTARFSVEERDDRERMLKVRSGLVKLYNDLLRIQVPVGVVARMVRRGLGYAAAAEIPGFWARLGVRSLEFFRIWLLIGAQLHRLFTVAPVLVRPLITSRAKARVSTAGSLIFRFRALRVIWTFFRNIVSLYVLSSSWVLLSVMPALILIALHQWANASWYLAVFFGLPYLFPILMALVQAVSKHDVVTHMDAFIDGLKGFSQFLFSLFIWGIFTYLLFLPLLPNLIEGMLDVISVYTTSEWTAGSLKLSEFSISTESKWTFFTGFMVTLGILCLAATRYFIERVREHKDTGLHLGLWDWYARSFLRSYGLARSLLHHYPMEKFLAEHFDPEYYGPLTMDHAIEESLRSSMPRPAPERDPTKCHECSKKTIGGYFRSAQRSPSIVLGLGVANVGGNGGVEIVPESVPIVCGLRAATALVPLLPPVEINSKLYVDATNVTSVPMPALIKLLRHYGINEGVTAIHAYRVAPVPFSSTTFEWNNTKEPVVNLVDIALRALRLRQHHDADLERRLTLRYSKQINNGEHRLGDKSYFKIFVMPVELDIESGLNYRILFSDRSQRRTEILTTIAQGCHAAMQAMIPSALSKCTKADNRIVKCHKVVKTHIKGHTVPIIKTVASNPLPGSVKAEEEPPGLPEICQYCCKEFNCKPLGESFHDWPHELQLSNTDTSSDDFKTPDLTDYERHAKIAAIKALGNYWARPQQTDEITTASSKRKQPVSRPTVSLLFSGGVFRGVFQLGVVNALLDLGVKPDVVAGASVGSITAAVAAHILAGDKASNEVTSRLQLSRLAASYLAIDRIILTDRFADFVREFTLRAADTRFSLYKADRLFRKYDQPLSSAFDHGAREVIAGIERLFYINFYQLNRLVRALRQRHHKLAARYMKIYMQQWLNRMNVGEEMLGAEPLDALIRNFICFEGAGVSLSNAADRMTLEGCFEQFLVDGIVFLATTTELLDGRLETLGNPFEDYGKGSRVDLVQSLLASSAFPSVFRARSTSELFPNANHNGQYIDGGVMDNLPIDAVVRLLEDTSDTRVSDQLILRRPYGKNSNDHVPHLVFAASLEPDVKKIEQRAHLHAIQSYWPWLHSRIKKLNYNHKLDVYAQAAREISALYQNSVDNGTSSDKSKVLDIEIAALKPNWLCGTFAFHPMLGYRRERQAASIAHGCALTLLKLRGYDNKQLMAWGIHAEDLPKDSTLEDAIKTAGLQTKRKANDCWLRNKTCPFSKSSLNDYNQSTHECGKRLNTNTINELSNIHTLCCHPNTHIA